MNPALVALNFALVYVLWGSTYLGIQVVVREHIPPATMGALRFSIAGIVLLAICAALGKKIILPASRLFRLGTIGVLLLTCGNVVLAWAEMYIPTGFAALLIATVPLWMALWNRFVFRDERLTVKSIVGLLLGLAGIVVLVWPKLATQSDVESHMWFGSAIVFVSAMSWSFGSVLSHEWGPNVDAFVASAWQMLIAGIVNTIIAIALGDHHTVVWTQKGVIALTYLIIAGSLIGYTSYIWLLKNVATSKVSTYAYVNPIVAVFLGWLILNEPVDSFVFIGAAIIVASVWLVTSSKVKNN